MGWNCLHILSDWQLSLLLDEAEETFQIEGGAGSRLLVIEAAAELPGIKVRPDSQAMSSFTTTSANSWLLSILCFVRTNISIIFWETLRALVLEPLNDSSFEDISSDRSRQMITFSGQLTLGVRTWTSGLLGAPARAWGQLLEGWGSHHQHWPPHPHPRCGCPRWPGPPVPGPQPLRVGTCAGPGLS